MKRSGKNTTLFDMSVGPSFLLVLGVPVYLVAAVIGLGVIAAVLIVLATRKKGSKAEKDNKKKENGEEV